jgi:hypothetical protein
MMGESQAQSPSCSQCGQPIAPEHLSKPCPACGDSRKTWPVELAAKVEVRTSMALRARHGLPGKIKPFLKEKISDSYSTARKKWMHREQLADAENNHYHELVTDPETGEVIHECDEPLDQHRRRGCAKRPPDSTAK